MKKRKSLVLTYFVEVEGKLSWNGTVEASLQVGDPILSENVPASSVFFANACHATVHAFATVDVLDGRFPEEEQHKVADIEGAHKIRFCNIARD